MNPTTDIAPFDTHTVCYSRKVSDGNYGSEEATMFLQFDTPRGTPNEQIMALGANAFAAAKAQVLHELGIDMFPEQVAVAVTEPQMSVEDQIRAEFAGAQVVEQPSTTVSVAAAPTNTATTVAGAPFVDPTDPYGKNLSKDQKEANKAWAIAAYRANPGDFWDNRETKKNPKAPDFKHRETGIGLWAEDLSTVPSAA